MQNNIIQKENLPLNIKRLQAQRKLYTTAKTYFSIQLIFSVPVIILISFVVLAFGRGWFKLTPHNYDWIIGASGVLFLFIDIAFLNTVISNYREKAAKIQQCFDCDVLNLKWNKIAYGNTPDPEDTEIWSQAYIRSVREQYNFTNWYRVEVGVLPLNVGKIVCQRANCWWDASLRKRYNILLYVTGIILTALIASIAIFLNGSIQEILTLIIAPVLPFWATAVKLMRENREAITRLDAMKDAIGEFWGEVINRRATPVDIEAFSEMIQGGIFANRKNNPLVFDWIHSRMRTSNENALSRSTEYYVEEYNRQQF
jgi:hypothetical protein